MKSVIDHCRHRVTANRIIVSRIMAFASLLLLAGIITVPSDVSAHQMADYTGMVFPPDHALNDLWTLSLPQIAPILPYLMLVLMLIFRPTGLFGTRET